MTDVKVIFFLMQYWPSEAYFLENMMHVILYFLKCSYCRFWLYLSVCLSVFASNALKMHLLYMSVTFSPSLSISQHFLCPWIKTYWLCKILLHPVNIVPIKEPTHLTLTCKESHQTALTDTMLFKCSSYWHCNAIRWVLFHG